LRASASSRALTMWSMISSIVETCTDTCERSAGAEGQVKQLGIGEVQAQCDARNLRKQAAWPKRRPGSVIPSLVQLMSQPSRVFAWAVAAKLCVRKGKKMFRCLFAGNALPRPRDPGAEASLHWLLQLGTLVGVGGPCMSLHAGVSEL
jgi:hypothetical protein